MNTLIRLREQHQSKRNDSDNFIQEAIDDDVRPFTTVTSATSRCEDNQDYEAIKKDEKIITTIVVVDANDNDVQKDTTTTKVLLSLKSPNNVRRFLDVSARITSSSSSPVNDNHVDMYAPLMPEEADEDQLADFFTGLDVSFLQQEGSEVDVVEEKALEVASSSPSTPTTIPDVMFHPPSKRRRVSVEEGGEHYSSSSSNCSYYSIIDTDDDYDCFVDVDENVLRRKLRSKSNFLCRNE